MTRGRFADSKKHLQIAAELDPLSLGPQLNQVTELMHERDYPESKRKVEAILRTTPANPVALYLASSIAFWQRDCPAATAWSRRLLDAYPQALSAAAAQQGADFVCGRPHDGKAAVAGLLRNHPSAYISRIPGLRLTRSETMPKMR